MSHLPDSDLLLPHSPAGVNADPAPDRPADDTTDDTALTADEVAAALAIRDLTDPTAGPHALQIVTTAIEDTLARAWGVPVRRDPGPRIVTVADNYDALGYTAHAATRDRRYTRYLGAGRMLRSHTSARIPALLRDLATTSGPTEVLLTVPGITYRRDVIDRHHVGEPHQMDLWLIRTHGPALTTEALHAMVGVVVATVLPGHTWTTPDSPHPYTRAGREIIAHIAGTEVEIGECGLASPDVLAAAGLPATASGLAMGLGLDRLVMLAKNMTDIRLLRSTDPRIAAQMGDLTPYRPVSMQPAARRDISIAIPADTDDELLGDQVRDALGDDAAALEEMVVLSRIPLSDLPAIARERLGIADTQAAGGVNVLLRLVLRDLDRTLTAAQANALRDRVYAAVHTGTPPTPDTAQG